MKLDKAPDFAVVDVAEYPVWAGAPRQYRFDGQTGQYHCADAAMPSIKMQPFDYRWREEERWGRAYQAWLDVAFVDADGCVSQISLKKDSAVALYELIIGAKNVEGQEVALCAIECRLTQHCREVNRDGAGPTTFFVVDVATLGYVKKKKFEQVLAFAQSECFEWRLVGEVERPSGSESFVPL
jgi:hypothetical protein